MGVWTSMPTFTNSFHFQKHISGLYQPSKNHDFLFSSFTVWASLPWLRSLIRLWRCIGSLEYHQPFSSCLAQSLGLPFLYRPLRYWSTADHLYSPCWCGSPQLSLLNHLLLHGISVHFPKAGGEYAYIKCTFGDVAGFVMAWTKVLILLPAFYAILAMTAVDYIMGCVMGKRIQDSITSSVFSILLLGGR